MQAANTAEIVSVIRPAAFVAGKSGLRIPIIDTTTAHATHERPALHATADSGPNEGHLPS